MIANILVVEDDAVLREALGLTLQTAGYATYTAEDAATALRILREARIDLVVSDVQMPNMDGVMLLEKLKSQRADLPVILMTAYGSIDNAVRAMQFGASDYLVKPFEAEVLVTKLNQWLPHQSASSYEGFVAADPKTFALLDLAKRVAVSDATVLIMGESGVGKEVLFRYLHMNSKRVQGPAVAINCAAIPDNMLEAILFGYEKGAFTGAYKACPGKFELAQQGSILLDEITEMSLPLQAKLLRVLQEREVERLGGAKPIALDVRVVATTNRSMREEVAAGRFREDLYYRLNVFPLHVHPLRERRADIIPLAEFFLSRAAKANNMALPVLEEDAKRRLQNYAWPGNARELDNVMQRALIIHMSGRVSANDLHLEADREEQELISSAIVVSNPNEYSSSGGSALEDDVRVHEQRLILEALAEGHGSRAFAAEKLKISPRTLRYKIAKMREQGYVIPAA